MKFKYSLSPSYHAKTDTKSIMNDVIFALLFVSFCSVILQYNLYGMAGLIRAVLILVIAVAGCVLVDYIYWSLNKVKNTKLKDKVRENVPIITGLIIGLTMPLGDLDSYMMLYVTFISAIVAELFGKAIYGGFGYNIFNPAAVGRAFSLVAFGKFLVIPTISGLSGASPLTALGQENGLEAVNDTFRGYNSLLFGFHQGAIGEGIIVALLIAGAYLLFRKVIDWIIPVFSVVTVAVLAAIMSILQGGFNIDFIIIHVLSGGLIFAVVFMLTDPITNPNSNQGKMIYAIIFGLITFLIRVHANLAEGVIFAILIVNMLVPLIDNLTANVTTKDVMKKVGSVAVVSLVAIVVTVLFYYV